MMDPDFEFPHRAVNVISSLIGLFALAFVTWQLI